MLLTSDKVSEVSSCFDMEICELLIQTEIQFKTSFLNFRVGLELRKLSPLNFLNYRVSHKLRKLSTIYFLNYRVGLELRKLPSPLLTME